MNKMSPQLTHYVYKLKTLEGIWNTIRSPTGAVRQITAIYMFLALARIRY